MLCFVPLDFAQLSIDVSVGELRSQVMPFDGYLSSRTRESAPEYERNPWTAPHMPEVDVLVNVPSQGSFVEPLCDQLMILHDGRQDKVAERDDRKVIVLSDTVVLF